MEQTQRRRTDEPKMAAISAYSTHTPVNPASHGLGTTSSALNLQLFYASFKPQRWPHQFRSFSRSSWPLALRQLHQNRHIGRPSNRKPKSHRRRATQLHTFPTQPSTRMLQAQQHQMNTSPSQPAPASKSIPSAHASSSKQLHAFRTSHTVERSEEMAEYWLLETIPERFRCLMSTRAPF